MADPRLTVSWDGLGAEYASFKSDNSTIVYSATTSGGSAGVGLAVTLIAATAQTIELVGDAEGVLGKLIKVEVDNIANVQIAGAMTLPAGDAATLTRQKSIVGALGVAAVEGYIRDVDTAAPAELGVRRGFVIDDAVSTAAWVWL